MYILWAAIALAEVGEATWTELVGERVVLTHVDGRTLTGELVEVDELTVEVRIEGRSWDIPREQVEAAALAPEAPEEPVERPDEEALALLRDTDAYREGWADGALAGQQLSVQQPAVAGVACGAAGGAGCCFVGPLCAFPVLMTPIWIYAAQDYPAEGLTDPYALGYHEGMAETWTSRSTRAALGGSVVGGAVGVGVLLSGWATWMAWQNGAF